MARFALAIALSVIAPAHTAAGSACEVRADPPAHVGRYVVGRARNHCDGATYQEVKVSLYVKGARGAWVRVGRRGFAAGAGPVQALTRRRCRSLAGPGAPLRRWRTRAIGGAVVPASPVCKHHICHARNWHDSLLSC